MHNNEIYIVDSFKVQFGCFVQFLNIMLKGAMQLSCVTMKMEVPSIYTEGGHRFWKILDAATFRGVLLRNLQFFRQKPK